VDASALRELKRDFAGELIVPASPSYDDARRVWNGSIDRKPALVARCVRVDDVQSALAFARRTGMSLAVRGGGHSFPGLSVCDGGVVIDLRRMNDVQVDPTRAEVLVEPGTLLGELDAATQRHGLAVPIGAVSHTGVAGLTLGGGIGWIMRKHGLTIDQLRSVEVLTADGERITASSTENADLFWAVRGGGGNFGIVTGFRFQAQPVGPVVLAGLLLWPAEVGSAVARFYRDWSSEAPDELMTALVMRKAPAAEFIPTALHERPVVGILCCWIGDAPRGARVMRPMREFGAPVLDAIEPRPYLEFQSLLDPSYPHGLWAYVKSCDLSRLDDDVIDSSLEHAHAAESPKSGVIFWQLGGAVGRVASAETAFGSRASSHVVNITGATMSAEGFDQERAWTRAFYAALEPQQTGVYVNFLMDEGEDRVRQAYGPERYERLSAIKRRYDPDNVFRLNQNVRPA
jgi:FAD/FMN-containing dehydrogenase